MSETYKSSATTVAFGDVVQLSKERSQDPEADGFARYIGLEHLDPGELKVRRWGASSDGVTFTSVFRSGQVLFGKRRAYQRKVALADFSGVCSGDIYVLEPKGDQLLPELLPFICQSEPFYDYVMSMSQGGLSPRVNWKALAKYEFALPTEERQRQIAELLHAAENAKRKLHALGARSRLLLDSIATQLLKQDALKDLCLSRPVRTPLGWQVMTFDQVCERITYGFTNPMPTTDDGPWMVTAADVKDGRINYDTARHTSREAYDRDLTDKSRVRVGDILLTKDGTLGRVAVVDRAGMCVNQSVAVLRPSSEVLPQFLAWTLRAPVMQWRLMLDAGGSAVRHLYITKVAETRLLIPPLTQQEQIVARLELTESALDGSAERERECAEMVNAFAARLLAGQA